MWALWTLRWSLLVLLAVSPPAWSRSFPSSPDATEAEQQRWGTSSAGYLVEGCWWRPPSSGMTVEIEPCRAFALETNDPPALKGFAESTRRSLTFAGGDGRYWVAGRTAPGLAAPGWACLDGIHYCWSKSDTPPAVPSGMLLLAQATVTAGLVGPATVMAPLRRTTPLVVPAGVTLILGACPEVPRRPLFQADGLSTGLIRFGAGACGVAYPEWWGADPTGQQDATAAWQQAIDAVSGSGTDDFERLPLACEGSYRITGPLTVRSRLNIHGRQKVSTSGQKTTSCELRYVGTGNLFEAPLLYTPPAPVVGYGDLDFRHIRILDVNSTADRAFQMYVPAGMTMENIFVQGFNTPWYLMGSMVYSKLSGLMARFYRQRCLEISGPANFSEVTVTCGASEPTVLHGVRVGFEPFWWAQSTNFKLRASVEAASGTPILLAEQKAIDAELYVEQPGQCSAYGTFGAIYLAKINGGRLQISTTGNCQGADGPIARGVLADALPNVSGNQSVNNVTFTGRIHTNYVISLQITAGPGMWGNTVTGLEYDASTAAVGDFTTGVLLGKAYWTHGVAPIVDQGMGSTEQGWEWTQGSMIHNLGNVFWSITAPGNPPEFVRLVIPSTWPHTVALTEATPTIKEGNTYHTRLRVAGGSGAVPITYFADGFGGICLDLTAVEGARTIEGSDLSKISLRDAPSDYVMQAGNTLRLCLDDANAAWRETSRCETCQ